MPTPKKTTPSQGRKRDKTHVWLTDEQATSLVAEAEVSIDPVGLCKRYGVHPISLQRWQKRVAADAALTALVEKKRQAIRDEWKDLAISAMREVLGALRWQAAKARDLATFDPDAMHKLAGAGKILGELLIGEAIIPSGTKPRDNRKDSAAPTAAAVGTRAPSGERAPAGTPGPAPTSGTGTPVH